MSDMILPEIGNRVICRNGRKGIVTNVLREDDAVAFLVKDEDSVDLPPTIITPEEIAQVWVVLKIEVHLNPNIGGEPENPFGYVNHIYLNGDEITTTARVQGDFIDIGAWDIYKTPNLQGTIHLAHRYSILEF